jgi:hypothetical protein
MVGDAVGCGSLRQMLPAEVEPTQERHLLRGDWLSGFSDPAEVRIGGGGSTTPHTAMARALPAQHVAQHCMLTTSECFAARTCSGRGIKHRATHLSSGCITLAAGYLGAAGGIRLLATGSVISHKQRHPKLSHTHDAHSLTATEAALLELNPNTFHPRLRPVCTQHNEQTATHFSSGCITLAAGYFGAAGGIGLLATGSITWRCPTP